MKCFMNFKSFNKIRGNAGFYLKVNLFDKTDTMSETGPNGSKIDTGIFILKRLGFNAGCKLALKAFRMPVDLSLKPR